MRAAIVLSAVAGLAAAGSSAPGVRNAGTVILGVAASLATLDMIHSHTGTAATAASANLSTTVSAAA